MRPVPCIISYAGVLSDERFLKTIPIETGFWKDSVLFFKRPPRPATDRRWKRLPKGLRKFLTLKKTKWLSPENSPIRYEPEVFWPTGRFGIWALQQQRLVSTSGWANPLSVAQPIEAKKWSTINYYPWKNRNAQFQPRPSFPLFPESDKTRGKGS